MSPTDSFRPTLSLPVEQAMSFLSLASRRIPEAEQLDTARDLNLSSTAVVDENAFSETALALWESMKRARAIMTMASLTPTHPTHRNLRIWLSRPYATVARARGEKIHIYRIDTEEIPHVVAANSPLRPRPEAFDGPPYLPSEFIGAATDGDLGAPHHLRPLRLPLLPGPAQPPMGIHHLDTRQHHPRRPNPLGCPECPFHSLRLLPGHPATR